MYQVYQPRSETRRTGSASLAIYALFLLLPNKRDIKIHWQSGKLFSYVFFAYKRIATALFLHFLSI